MNGVIFIKEIMDISAFGYFLLGAICIVSLAMFFGGIKLWMEGCRSCCDGMEIAGFITLVVDLVLSCSIYAFINSEDLSCVESLGLAKSTGKYEVTVTAEADMNEFQERYEILSFENGVYTIKIK